MKHIINYKLKDGSSFEVEVDIPESETVTRSGLKDLPKDANMLFEDALGKVKPMAAAIIKEMRNITDPTPEVEVEFGLKLTASAGAIITSIGGEANYRLTLKWQGEK